MSKAALVMVLAGGQRFIQSGAEGYTGTGGAGHEGRRCVLSAAQQPDGAPVSGGRIPDRERTPAAGGPKSGD